MKKQIIKKPWGHEKIIFREASRTVKVLVLAAGKRTSLQYHNRKIEYVLLLKGDASLRVDGFYQALQPNHLVQVAPFSVHRYSSVNGAELLEFCIGDDSDIIRLQDDFGR